MNKKQRSIKRYILILLGYSGLIFGSSNTILWEGEYYDALPIKNGISK